MTQKGAQVNGKEGRKDLTNPPHSNLKSSSTVKSDSDQLHENIKPVGLAFPEFVRNEC